MTGQEILVIVMVAGVCGALMLGFPVAFTLLGASMVFGLIGHVLGVFSYAFFGVLPNRIFGIMTNEVLIAVPLFVYMGVMLERSKVAEELLDTMGSLFGAVRGGLAISVCVVGALLAASTGIVGATVVTMGLLALPTMLKRGYDPTVACGTISAAGTLGQIIPPSIVLILLGDVLSTAYQQSQLEQGIFSPETISVGDLFAGALFPGLMLVGMYLVYLIALATLRPAAMPAPPLRGADETGGSSLWRHLAEALVPPVILIVAVLGSILGGIATPTEAASVGAVGAVMLAGHHFMPGRPLPMLVGAVSLAALLAVTSFHDLRLQRTIVSSSEWAWIGLAALLTAAIVWGIAVALWRGFRTGILRQVIHSTGQLTAMVFLILIGAALFTVVFRGLGGDDTVRGLLEGVPGGSFGAMVVVMAAMFLLGFFLDFIEITLVVVPIVAPALMLMGLDPVWIGVMMAVNLQTSFLTPPFGFALFYLRAVAPPEVRTAQIYRGVVPFVAIQLLALVVLAAFPDIVTWLPAALYGR